MPRVLVLYQYMHPDDVVSARHFDGLCRGLKERGWDVEAWPSNRACWDPRQTFPRDEEWEGVRFRRVWRPALAGSRLSGRLANAAWMVARWSRVVALRGSARPDVVIVGTDPVFAVSLLALLQHAAPQVKRVHWCFDLHPEASVADGHLAADSPLVKGVQRVLQEGYRACQLLADLGPCMQQRLHAYGSAARQVTLTPWALVEPPAPPPVDAQTRRALFGDAPLALLYSGTFGRAHAYELTLELARRLRGQGVHFCFAGRGHGMDALRAQVSAADTNVHLAGFAPEAELEQRLAAADIHVASMRPGWEGVVVPSKFFGSLASARPVLFEGPPGSALATWIDQHCVGWRLTAESLPEVAAALGALAADPAGLQVLQAHCHRVYQEHFARRAILDRWDAELRALLAGP